MWQKLLISVQDQTWNTLVDIHINPDYNADFLIIIHLLLSVGLHTTECISCVSIKSNYILKCPGSRMVYSLLRLSNWEIKKKLYYMFCHLLLLYHIKNLKHEEKYFSSVSTEIFRQPPYQVIFLITVILVQESQTHLSPLATHSQI